ncbi:MAG: cysteine hydrolase family protein, partial [Candidatus Cryosericum sp.]
AQRAVQAARMANAAVIHVTRGHRPTGIDIDFARRQVFAQSGGLLVTNTPGAEEVPELAPALEDLVVVKKRWSAFFATDLDLLLRRLAIRQVVLAGVQTPNCIRATAMDALSLDYATTVLSDATASQTDAVQAANLADMAAMGITIEATLQFVQSLGL